jgi:hypothetical protein
VGEHVPEVDDAPVLRYPRSHFRKVAREPCEGFPDNLERSLDRSIARCVRRSSTNWLSVMSPSNATMSSAARIAS